MNTNVKLKNTVTLRAKAHCPTHSRADVSVRDLTSIIDEPEARGGTNMGMTPTDTALAALIGCTNVIGQKCAEMLGIDIGHLDISATCDFDRRGVSLAEEVDVPFPNIRLNVVADGSASTAELARVSTELGKYCPLSKLFRQAGTVIEESWSSKADGA